MYFIKKFNTKYVINAKTVYGDPSEEPRSSQKLLPSPIGLF